VCGREKDSCAQRLEFNSQPVVAESYDEIVFTDPDEDFYTFLMLYMKTPDDGSGNRSNKKPNTLPYQVNHSQS
jgi:hypothetical protein